MNRTRMLVLAMLCVVGLLGSRAWAQVLEDRWYVVQMQGQHCGHMHAQTVKQGDRFISTSEMRMEISRAGAGMTVAISTEFIETGEGKPVRMKSEMKLGSLPTVDEYVFNADGVEATHSVAGSKRTEQLPLPADEWMTPRAVERHVSGKIAAGEKEIVARTLEPSSGLTPVKSSMRLLDRTSLDVVGKTVPAIKWATLHETPTKVESIEFTDEKGGLLKSEMDMGGMKLVLLQADRALAMSKVSPAELLESTFILPDKAIKDPRQAARGAYLVRVEEGTIAEWPSTGSQTVERVDERTLRIRVDRSGSSAANKTEQEGPEFRQASMMVNSTDEKVVALRDEALKGKDKSSPAEKAEALRKFVHGYIQKKNFDVGFASAAETARTRCGDCTEHGVLLCALLRASGLPARCVSGLVYVDGIGKGGRGAFGYHMWTQVMVPREGVEGGMRWVDLDATLDADAPFDGTHLAIQTLSMADGQTVNALMEILPTLGKLKISVEKPDGK